MYKRKPPNNRETPPINDPIPIPIIIGTLFFDTLVGFDWFGEVNLVVAGSGGVGSDGVGSGGTKMLVHIYSSLLLISSNKRSLSLSTSPTLLLPIEFKFAKKIVHLKVSCDD